LAGGPLGPASPSAGGPPGPRPPLPGALTLSSRAPPGAPLRPDPASVPRCLTLLAGGSGRGRSAGGCSLQASSGPDEGSPPPAARPAPRGPASPGPPPPVTEAGPRPDTGGAQEERARRRVAGVNVPDVGRVGAASAPSAAGTPRPVPQPWRGARGRRVRKCHRLLSGAGWPLGLRLAGSDRSHAQIPAPRPCPKPHSEPRPQTPPR